MNYTSFLGIQMLLLSVIWRNNTLYFIEKSNIELKEENNILHQIYVHKIKSAHLTLFKSTYR